MLDDRYSNGFRYGFSTKIAPGLYAGWSAPIKIGRTRAGFMVGRFVLALFLTAVWAGIVLDTIQRHGL